MKNQWVESNMDRITKIYNLYHEAVKEVDVACKQKCSACCTCNVTMTRLEADFVMHSLSVHEKKQLFSRIEQHFPQKRYLPKMTANMFADFCVNGKPMPEEENDPSWGTCPLLVDDMCSIYDVRPLGCRVLLSQKDCRKNGYALMPPLVLTVSNLFLQYIEHADQTGFFGNLSDMLSFYPLDEPMDDSTGVDKDRFLLNQKISVLMIPVEHRERLYPLLKKLVGLTDDLRDDVET